MNEQNEFEKGRERLAERAGSTDTDAQLSAASSQGDVIDTVRRLVAEGASVSAHATGVVLDRMDDTERALTARMSELLGLRAEARSTERQITVLQDLADRRLAKMREQRAELAAYRQRAAAGIPTPADLYGPQSGVMTSPLDALFSDMPDELRRAIERRARETFEGVSGKPGSPFFAMDSGPFEGVGPMRIDADGSGGFARPAAGFGETLRDALDNLFSQPREQLAKINGMRKTGPAGPIPMPGEQIIEVSPGVFVGIGEDGPCSDPQCTACGMARDADYAASFGVDRPQRGSDAAAADAEREQDANPRQVLTARQVADLPAGTWFRMVEMGGVEIRAHVLPMVRMMFGPTVEGVPAFELLTPEGMPVPPNSTPIERKTFEDYMRALDERDARFEITG